MVNNNILAFLWAYQVLFYNSLHRSMCIKATIVAYAFLVQCFENATIVAYLSLRVKSHRSGSLFRK